MTMAEIMPYLFLSIQAQDFIEDKSGAGRWTKENEFLSIQAQDFIEEQVQRNRDS